MSYLPQGTSPSIARSNALSDVVPLGASTSDSLSPGASARSTSKSSSFEDSIKAALSQPKDPSGTHGNTGSNVGSRSHDGGSGENGPSKGRDTSTSGAEPRRPVSNESSRTGSRPGAQDKPATSTDLSAHGQSMMSSSGDSGGSDGLQTEESVSTKSASPAESAESKGETSAVEPGLQWMLWAAASQSMPLPTPPPTATACDAGGGSTAVAEVTSVEAKASAGEPAPSTNASNAREASLKGDQLSGRHAPSLSPGQFQWAPNARWSGQVWERLGLTASQEGVGPDEVSANPTFTSAISEPTTAGTKLPGEADPVAGSAEFAGQSSPQGSLIPADWTASRLRIDARGTLDSKEVTEGAKALDLQAATAGEEVRAARGAAMANLVETSSWETQAESEKPSGTSGAETSGTMRSVVSNRGESSRINGGKSPVQVDSALAELSGTEGSRIRGMDQNAVGQVMGADADRSDKGADDDSGADKAASVVQGMMAAGSVSPSGRTSESGEAESVAGVRNTALEAAFAQEVGPRLMELRQQTPHLMTLVLRPDQQTELFVELRHRDGQVEIQVRVDRGDTTAVRASWEHLKNTFSSQGITLHPLMEGGSAGGLAQGLAAGADQLNRQTEALAGQRLSATAVDGMGLGMTWDPRGLVSATMNSSSTGSGSEESSSFRRDEGSDARQGQGSDRGLGGDFSGNRESGHGGRQGQPDSASSDVPIWAEALRRGVRGGVRDGGEPMPAAAGAAVRSDVKSAEAWDAWA